MAALRMTAYSRAQLGIGLIELLVSMLIGLFIMAGVFQMFSTTSQNAVVTAGASRIQENIRFAFSKIDEDIVQSGSLGCISAPSVRRYSTGDSIITNLLGFNSAAVTDNSTYDFLTIANGFAAPVSAVDVFADNTDIFQIRYLNNSVRIEVASIDTNSQITLNVDGSNGGATGLISTLDSGDIVGVANCTNGAVFVLTAKPATSGPASGVVAITTGTVAGVHNASLNMDLSQLEQKSSKYYLYGGSSGVYEYYIGSSASGTCNVSTAQQNCALFRRTSGGAAEELVQGVHDIDVLFGIIDATGKLAYKIAADVAAAEWSLVDRMKVTLTFNSIDEAKTQGNNIDGLLTKTISRTFNLYNQL
jgi:type IV pilus assembly protein PilW